MKRKFVKWLQYSCLENYLCAMNILWKTIYDFHAVFMLKMGVYVVYEARKKKEQLSCVYTETCSRLYITYIYTQLYWRCKVYRLCLFILSSVTTNTIYIYTQLLYRIQLLICGNTETLQQSHMLVKVGLSVLKIFSYIYALYQTVHLLML